MMAVSLDLASYNLARSAVVFRLAGLRLSSDEVFCFHTNWSLGALARRLPFAIVRNTSPKVLSFHSERRPGCSIVVPRQRPSR